MDNGSQHLYILCTYEIGGEHELCARQAFVL